MKSLVKDVDGIYIFIDNMFVSVVSVVGEVVKEIKIFVVVGVVD